MKYALLIYSEEGPWENASPQQIKETMEAYGAFGQAVEEAGALLAGDGLETTRSATTVRVRDGERLVTDGPFAETKETLGGFYLLECKDLDEALDWAAKIPDAQYGSVEVRPVMDYEAMQAMFSSSSEEARA